MDSIILYNRKTLLSVPMWIKKEDWDTPPSLFNYGLPEHVLGLIDKDISTEMTECDILCYIMMLFNKQNIRIKYLEIGVSVGKTFYQIAKYIQNNTASGYSINCLDIEQINPILKGLISLLRVDKYNTRDIPTHLETPSIRNKDTNSILEWGDRNNTITYFESDEFDIDIWKSMGNGYNIIFSDALHEPSALLAEYKYLKHYNMIDYNMFVYCFDDLEHDKSGQMWGAVLSIYNDLVATTNKTLYLKHYKVNGWLGNNEFKHNFGIISSFDVIIPNISSLM